MVILGAGISGLLCSDTMKDALARYANGLADLLPDCLLGAYLYGSLARGCANGVSSDVDIIVVVRDSAIILDSAAILQFHQASGLPYDVVFATECDLQIDVFPAPVALLVKSFAGGKVCDKPEGSHDFLLQRQDAYEAGVSLFGPPPQALLRAVPWPLLVESLDYLFPYIVTHFKNPVLMLCRIAFAYTQRRLCGKREAGEWALASFPACWEPLITMALAEYAAGTWNSAIPGETVRQFEEHCAQYLHSLRADIE